MSSWDEQTRRAHAYEQQIEAIAIRTGSEPIQRDTPLDALAAMEAAAAVEVMFQELCHEQLEAGLDYEEALAAALREVKVKAAAAGWKAAFRWIYAGGWHPEQTIRRQYAGAMETAPELIAGMTLADLASILGETRSATDGRQVKLFKGTKVRGRHRKRTLSVERMRESARGNSNRKNGEKKRRVLALGARAAAAGNESQNREKV